ncbi:MAG TPA: family 10 glycosylhydrolase [Candidatus Limnocylindria bacterium]|nr:family 10 glycosylhydrolase [Candidatus Limnocylindria bacterium]
MDELRVWLGRSLAVLLVALACASPAAGAGAATGSSTPPTAVAGGQLRAFWVDAFGDGLYTQAQIDQVVADVKAANLNAIVAQVVRRGDCFCNHSSLPRTTVAGVSPAPFDPLRSLIDAAHAQGIQVHAWIITTGIWQGPALPTDPAHAFTQHGPSAAGAANWIDYRSDGAASLNNEYFLDPGHPDAAQYIVNMATSIASNYDVDGINLDRIRYPDGNFGTNVPSWGYNPTALARFQAATGRTDRPANTDAAWTQWRRDQVTGIVRKIYLETYAIRRGITISADTISYGSGPQSVGGWEKTRTYAEVLQDWVGWLREGILDLNIVMNYKRDTDASQRAWFQQWSDFAKDSQFGRASAIGAALYLNDLPSSIRQARTAIAPSTAGSPSAGWNGYSYRTPDAATDAGTRTGASARAELINALTKPSADDPVTPPLFATPAPGPSLPWKDQPSLGQLRGTAQDAGGRAIAGAAVTLYDLSDRPVGQRVTDGSGWFGFVDLAPGSYRATIDSPSARASAGAVSVVAGQVASVAPAPAACASSTGPGIPPPASLPSGQSGFHAAWYGQSGYPTLCPGERSTATVAYYNSGSRGWVLGRMGEVGYLGTWSPVPGQDQPSPLGGDGQLGSPDTGWPRYNRVAIQPGAYVGPNQVAWFQFTIQAPTAPGTYRLYIRPLVEGAQWLEDVGVFWYVTVR